MLAQSAANDFAEPRTGALARIGQAARLSMPGLVESLPGSIAWAVLMGTIAWLNFMLAGWQDTARVQLVAAFFAAGGLLAFAPAIWIGRFLSRGRADAGFAATFLALAALTVGFTALLTAIQYRQYYAAWHDDVFTVRWGFQLVFTTLAAMYQFLVLGLRAYFPFGFVALIAASWWNATRLR